MGELSGRRGRPLAVPVALALLVLVSLLLLSDPTARSFRIGSVPAPTPAALPAGGTNTVVATIADISSPGFDPGTAPQLATYDPANGDLYVDSGTGLYAGTNLTNVTVIDGTTNKVVARLFLGDNAYPQTPVYAAASKEIYVADQNNTGVGVTASRMDNVTALSGTDTVAANIEAGYLSTPSSPVYDPANGYLYVSDQSTLAYLTYHDDNVTIINASTNTVVKQQPLGGYNQGPLTGVYDPADDGIYVPDNGYGSGTNLTLINASAKTTTTIYEELQTPETPVYDPVNQEVYVPNDFGYNLSVFKGASFVTNVSFGADYAGDLYATPAVDPLNGDVFVPVAATNQLIVVSPSNTIVTKISVLPSELTTLSPTWDPADGEMYVPALSSDAEGAILAINGSLDTVTAVIDVGQGPQTPTFDPANDDLYVPDDQSAEVSVIDGGSGTSSVPGHYDVSFSESGLPSGAWWTVTFNGTTLNQTGTTIDFGSFANASYAWKLDAWYSESTCTGPTLASGSLTVAGKAVATPLTFSCTAGTPPPPTGKSTSSGFLGLPGDDGYAVLGGVAAAAVAGGLIAVRFRGARPPVRPSPPIPPASPPTPPVAP